MSYLKLLKSHQLKKQNKMKKKFTDNSNLKCQNLAQTELGLQAP